MSLTDTNKETVSIEVPVGALWDIYDLYLHDSLMPVRTAVGILEILKAARAATPRSDNGYLDFESAFVGRGLTT